MEKKIHLEAPSERWSMLEREKIVVCVCMMMHQRNKIYEKKHTHTHSTKEPKKISKLLGKQKARSVRAGEKNQNKGLKVPNQNINIGEVKVNMALHDDSLAQRRCENHTKQQQQQKA